MQAIEGGQGVRPNSRLPALLRLPGFDALFEKAYHQFCLNRDEYMGRYDKRSNAESVFSMMKRKHGDAVRLASQATRHDAGFLLRVSEV